MSKESFVFILGFLVFLVTFLGIPQDWKRIFFIASGVMLMILGFMLRRAAFFRSIEKDGGGHESDVFAESFMTDADTGSELDEYTNTTS